MNTSLRLLLAAALLLSTAAAPAQPGANDWQCRPAPAQPHPVVLLHGTTDSAANAWSELAPRLARAGRCVFALDYGATPQGGGLQGLAPLAQSSEELGRFVERVLRASGAAKVDIVGHSQGGLVPRHYLRFGGGAARVRSLVGIAPPNHGTTSSGLAGYLEQFSFASELLLGVLCPACGDQLQGSAFLRALNEGGDTVPGVRYTIVASRLDDIVTPWESQLLRGPAVRNLVLQDLCPAHRVPHEQLAFDPLVLDLVMQALDAAPPAPPRCD